MNKKEIEKYKNNNLKKDEEMLMEAIHRNYRESREEWLMDQQLKAISKKEQKRKHLRNLRWANTLILLVFILTIVVVANI